MTSSSHHQDDDNDDQVLVHDPQLQSQSQQQSVPALSSFWQAVEQRRQDSDEQAARQQQPQRQNRCHAVLLGQLVALVAASVNATSFVLENSYQVVAPMSQLFVMYMFLSLHLLLRRRNRIPPQSSEDDYQSPEHPQPQQTLHRLPLLGLQLKIPWYLYLFFSSLDVGAGVIMLLSLQYTSLTSVTLLGSLTIPSTMLFSKILLKKSFYPHHFWGVALCMVGGCLTIWADLDVDPSSTTDNAGANSNQPSSNYSSSLVINGGDLMAITAALLYGLGDAVSEYSIKHIDRMEFLGMMGFFGMMLTGIQFPFTEGDVLKDIFGDVAAHTTVLILMASYVGLLLLYYVTEACFLVSSDATLLNLSLQAQNLWAILFSVLGHQAAPPGLFYLAVLLVFVGVAAYEVGGPSSDPVEQLIVRARVRQEEEGQREPGEASAPSPRPTAADDENDDKKRRQGGSRYSSIQQIEIM